MISKKRRKLLLGIVDRQMESEETGYVRDAYENLLTKGFCPISARSTIATVLSKEVYIVVGKNKKGFNEDSYRDGLQEILMKYRYNRKEVWPEAAELFKAGSKILRGHYNKPEALIYWEELWEMVKAVVEYENEKEHECMNLNDFDKKTGKRYGWKIWLTRMRKVYERNKQFENCIRFIDEVNKLFPRIKWDIRSYENSEMVLLWMLGRNEEADERAEQMRRSGYYAYIIDALLYYTRIGKRGKVVEVLEQILEESKYTYDYEYIYSAAAIIASFARREDLRQEFLMLDKKWGPK